MRADLHLHTTRSFDVNVMEGGMTPKMLLDHIASEKRVEVVAFTDHDKLSRYTSDLRAARSRGLHFLGATEVSTSFEGFRYLHALVYFNPNLKSVRNIEEILDDLNKGRREMCSEYIRRLLKMGYFRGRARKRLQSRESVPLSTSEIAHMLISRKYTFQKHLFPNTSQARKFLAGDEFKGVPRRIVPLTKLRTVVKGVGGVTILAHPWRLKYSNGQGVKMSGIERLVEESGIDGVEGWYPYHNWRTEISYSDSTRMNGELREWALSQGNLLLTGGSDFHNEGDCLPGVTYLPSEHTLKLLERLRYNV